MNEMQCLEASPVSLTVEIDPSVHAALERFAYSRGLDHNKIVEFALSRLLLDGDAPMQWSEVEREMIEDGGLDRVTRLLVQYRRKRGAGQSLSGNSSRKSTTTPANTGGRAERAHAISV